MLKSLSTVWPYLRRYRKGLGLGIASLVLKDLLAVALPVVIKHGVDSLQAGFQIRIVLELAALLVGDVERKVVLAARLRHHHSHDVGQRAGHARTETRVLVENGGQKRAARARHLFAIDAA